MEKTDKYILSVISTTIIALFVLLGFISDPWYAAPIGALVAIPLVVGLVWVTNDV